MPREQYRFDPNGKGLLSREEDIPKYQPTTGREQRLLSETSDGFLVDQYGQQTCGTAGPSIAALQFDILLKLLED